METPMTSLKRTLTKEEALLELLTQKTRVVTELQVAKTYFLANANPTKAAREKLRALEKKGLVVLSRSMLHPVLLLERPLLRWNPDDEAPNIGKLAWKTQRRWSLKPVMTLTARATERARVITGGMIGGRPERRSELLHDVHLTELYLTLCRNNPTLATTWTHEDTLCAQRRYLARDKIPDATIVRSDGVSVAIDFGGRYRAEKLDSIHRAMAKKAISYEIW